MSPAAQNRLKHQNQGFQNSQSLVRNTLFHKHKDKELASTTTYLRNE